MKRIITLCSSLVVGIAICGAGDETARKRGDFLTPRELAEFGEKSKVSYATTIVENSAELPAFRHPGFPKGGPLEETRYPVIWVGPTGSRALSSFRPSPTAQKALQDAEPLFQAKKYAEALPIYLDAVLKDPKCYLLYLSIGDCYLFAGNPVAALDNYDKARELNPSDYHVYWFRGSALLELGKVEEARHSYARALAMSPRNPSILKAINAKSVRLGVRATEELFHPRATARPEGDDFRIYTPDIVHWWLYGLCRAVWLAEEEHRKELTGDSEHHWTTSEELECTAILLASYRTNRDEGKGPREPELDLLLEVLSSKQLGAFVDYEFGSRFTPDYTIYLDDISQERIARFVEQYVFQKQ